MSDPATILGYGAIGLGFLLACLAYYLLSNEQKLEKPRGSIINAIYVFEVFCLSLVILGSILQYADNASKREAEAAIKETAEANRKIEALESELESARSQVASGTECQATLVANASIVRSQQASISTVNSIIDSLQEALQRQNNFAINDSCPGGAHGVPSNHAADITALNTAISAEVARIKGILVNATNAP